MRRLLAGTTVTLVVVVLALAIPNYLATRPNPNADHGGYTCSRSAFATYMHPYPDPPRMRNSEFFDSSGACNADARHTVRTVATVDLVGLALPLVILLGGAAAIVHGRRQLETVNYETWRRPGRHAV
jgi:hypothetical protein